MIMKKALLAAAVLGVSASAVNAAAILNVTAVVGARGTANGTNTVTTGIDTSSNTAMSYRIDFFASLSGETTPPDLGIGGFAFNINLGGNLARDTASGRTNYIAVNNSVLVDADNGVSAPQWQIDGDQGTPGAGQTDLQNIVVQMSTGLPTNSALLGGKFGYQASASSDQTTGLVGRVWVTFPGNSASNLGSVHISGVATSPGFSTNSGANTDGSTNTVLVNHPADPNYILQLPTDITFGSPVVVTGPSLALTTPAANPTTTIPGTGNSYNPTVLGANGSFTLGGTPDGAGHTFAAFDFSGGTDYSNFFGSQLPAGATQLTGTAATNLAAVFNKLGGSYDVIIDLGAGKPAGNLVVSSLPGGVTLNAVAAVPEPTTISLAGIGAVLAMSRRRRQVA